MEIRHVFLPHFFGESTNSRYIIELSELRLPGFSRVSGSKSLFTSHNFVLKHPTRTPRAVNYVIR